MVGTYTSLVYLFSVVAIWIIRLRQDILTWLGGAKLGAFHTESAAPAHIANEIRALAQLHESAQALCDMIRHGGGSAWPPKANHNHDDWPTALRGYKLVYLELAALLPVATASLDEKTNRMAIGKFRDCFRDKLRQHIDFRAVLDLLNKAENSKGTISSETHNAFYSCIAWCRHAYRWGIVPVVKVAQSENVIDLPPELVQPWEYLQRYFGCTSQSGNVVSSLILNFDDRGQHVFKSNYGLSKKIMSAEEEFSRLFRDIEESALPIYHHMVRAIIAFDAGEHRTCLDHLSRIQLELRPILSIYYDRLHDQKVPRSVWLSHIQGFFGWGAGYRDEQTGEFVQFDGLSGNQILLFQALDAFLGMDSYLSTENLERNVPMRQREFCRVLRKHAIRDKLYEMGSEDDAAEIRDGFDKIVKRLRLFRSAHRTRSLVYLRQPAPERFPMTAGKSMLSSDLEQSLEVLDEFMVTRLKQTA